MDETRTPNLYMAAFLVDAGEQLIECVPMDMYPDRALFVFRASKKIPFLVNKFLKGESRVEPRTYSLMIKDLKAKAVYDLGEYKKRGLRNKENSDELERLGNEALGSEEKDQGRMDERNSGDLVSGEETKI